MARTPSLRELRSNRPANVTILPTAASRKVEQHYGRAFGAARRAMWDSQAVAFPYKLPVHREEERRAASLDLLPGVPPFDPANPAHLRAWEALCAFGQRQWPSDREDPTA